MKFSHQAIERFLECNLFVIRHNERSAAPHEVKVILPRVSHLLQHTFPIPGNFLGVRKHQRSACICQKSPNSSSVPIIDLHEKPS